MNGCFEIQLKPTEDNSSVDESVAHDEEESHISASHESATVDGECPSNDRTQVEDSNTSDTSDDNEGPSTCAVLVKWIKYAVSLGLLIFSIVLVTSAIYTKQTSVSESTHPILAFMLLWILIIWLAMIEGGQGCLVGLQQVEKDLYANTHTITHKCTALVHKKGNLERFIVGRQFLVVLVVFGINSCGTAITDASVLGLPYLVNQIFLASGVALIITTIVCGQLAAQVNAARCMLDFINTNFMLFSTWISMAIEASGLLHAVYLVQAGFQAMSGNNNLSSTHQNACSKAFYWFRVVLSLAVLGFAFAVTLAALFDGKTAVWEGIPEYVAVILFFVLMFFVGLMEGIQIALFAVIKMPEEELKEHTMANTVCELVFRDSNFQAFLIGRQICVTICMFMVAKITSINVDVDEGENTIFGVPASVQEFFNTGILGAIITTIVGSLAWRVVASSFPLAFISNPLVYVVIRMCLFVEASGICSAALVLATVHRKLSGILPDEHYIGTPKSAEAEGIASTERSGHTMDRDDV